MVAGMNMGCECVRKGCLRESPVMRWTRPAEGDEFRNAREGLCRMQTNAVEKSSMMKNIGIMNARRCTLLSPFLFRLSWEVGIAIAFAEVLAEGDERSEVRRGREGADVED
jgi:hypothetical protein